MNFVGGFSEGHRRSSLGPARKKTGGRVNLRGISPASAAPCYGQTTSWRHTTKASPKFQGRLRHLRADCAFSWSSLLFTPSIPSPDETGCHFLPQFWRRTAIYKSHQPSDSMQSTVNVLRYWRTKKSDKLRFYMTQNTRSILSRKSQRYSKGDRSCEILWPAPQ